MKSYVEACRTIDLPFEKAASVELESFLAMDFLAFQKTRAAEGLDQARQLHKRIWLDWIADLLEEVKRDLGIRQILTLDTLGRVAKYHFDNKGCFMTIVESNKDRFVGIVDRCAFVEHSVERFGLAIGSEYHRSLDEIELAFAKSLVEDGMFENPIRASFDKSICRGDDLCRLCFTHL
jgi:hypothetical protein